MLRVAVEGRHHRHAREAERVLVDVREGKVSVERAQVDPSAGLRRNGCEGAAVSPLPFGTVTGPSSTLLSIFRVSPPQVGVPVAVGIPVPVAPCTLL